MAESSLPVDHFCCPVCLELLKDPVAVPCGHSFCKVCINDCWDQEDLKGVYSCPQCRRTFTTRPAVDTNTMLAEVVEKLKKTELHAASPAGPGDVECDVCTGRKLKALKSCLVCLASYCETHLQPHYQSPAFKKHKLVKASRRLQEQICSEHEKLLEVYCRTDQQCICMLCTMEDHKGHDTVSAAAERAEKQKQLVEIQKKYQQKIQEREKELQELKNTVEYHQSFQSLSAPPGSAVFPTVSVRPVHSFEEVVKSVSQLRDDVEKLCEEEIRNTSLHVKGIQITEPQTREDFLYYSCELTLDLNTVSKRLRLSEGNRVVTNTNTVQPYPDHPDRFEDHPQVLCRESVSGRCYWEVEWSVWVYIAVSYKNISRKGRGTECEFGFNDHSWRLHCSPFGYVFWHNNKKTVISAESRSCRIGVYVDYRAGTLSFYSVSDTMTLLHRVHTTFTHTIYPGFGVCSGSFKLC